MGLAKGKSNSKDRLIGKPKPVAGKTFRAVRLPNGLVRVLRDSSRASTRFALCIENADYPASLETLKVYEVIRDRFADAHDLVRVVDESGEDYLYPAEYFVRLSVTGNLEKALRELAEAKTSSL